MSFISWSSGPIVESGDQFFAGDGQVSASSESAVAGAGNSASVSGTHQRTNVIKYRRIIKSLGFGRGPTVPVRFMEG
jgi:hypothetical protein